MGGAACAKAQSIRQCGGGASVTETWGGMCVPGMRLLSPACARETEGYTPLCFQRKMKCWSGEKCDGAVGSTWSSQGPGKEKSQLCLPSDSVKTHHRVIRTGKLDALWLRLAPAVTRSPPSVRLRPVPCACQHLPSDADISLRPPPSLPRCASHLRLWVLVTVAI